ncbi:MAG: NAD(+)/NADH kinase [Oscillospiraceae bacterium]|nr:NAD(+)/NADH kinase [Oscillospiraceae bacterium]
MMADKRKAVLYPNRENDIDFKMSKFVGEIFVKNGWEISQHVYPGYPDLSGVEMIITFGGDGTILHAARAAADVDVPILGINMGGKGFIAELEVSDIELAETAALGDYKLETRMMIDIEIMRGGKVICNDFALNDIVIKGDNKVIEMTVFGDDEMITSFSGDGTIIATPTGSTAYSMSAGGPIVEPTAKNIIITPICAHVLEAKSFVLVATRIVTVDIDHKKGISAYVSIDGGTHINIQNGDLIKVSKSEKSTSLVRLSDRSFYHKISSKLISRFNMRGTQ